MHFLFTDANLSVYLWHQTYDRAQVNGHFISKNWGPIVDFSQNNFKLTF